MSCIFTAEIVSCSLDLKGGQAVDRVGVMLGLSFPAGKELEQLALQWEQPCKVKASVKGQVFSVRALKINVKNYWKQDIQRKKLHAFVWILFWQLWIMLRKHYCRRTENCRCCLQAA